MGALAFTPCSAICAGISAGLSLWNASYEVREHDYVGAALDVAGAASFGAGRYIKFARRGAEEGYRAMKGVRGMRSTRQAAGRALGRIQRRFIRHEKVDKYVYAGAAAYATHSVYRKFRAGDW